MPNEASTTEESMITYYIETTEGMFRLNVPTTWSVEMDHTRNGVVVAAISDDNGSVRQMFTGVQTIRDSSTTLQALNLATNQPEDANAPALFEWGTIPPSEPTNRYTIENMQLQSRRRRRVQVNLEDSIDTYDDDREVDFID